MKIRTNIKSGKNGELVAADFAVSNHNEKLAIDINTIEQKKTLGKKLRLTKETIRELKDSDLKAIVGGALNNSALTRCWASGCTCPNW